MASSIKKFIFILGVSILFLGLGIYLEAYESNQEFDGDFGDSYASNELYSGNRFTQKELGDVVKSNIEMTTGDSLISENGRFGFYIDRATGILKLKNKNTGYVYSSAVSDLKSTDANVLYSQLIASTVSVEFNTFDTEKNRYVIESTSQINMNKVTKSGDEAVLKANTDQVEIQYVTIENGISFQIKFLALKDIKIKEDPEAFISLEVQFILGSDGIEIFVPNESIQENKRLLKYLYIMPSFGYTREDVINGYMFLPDGPGALIRYEQSSSPQQIYRKFYSSDLGLGPTLKDSDRVEEKSLSAACFGKVNGVGQNGFISSIDQSGMNAELVVSPYGARNIRMNYLGVRYYFHSNFLMYGATSDYEKGRFQDDIRQNYLILSDEEADYVGMAKKYRDHLQKNELLAEEKKIDYKMHVEFINSENIKGLLSPKNKVLTNLEESTKILKKINQEKFSIVLKGWNKGGLSGNTPYNISLNGKVGSKTDIRKFNEQYQDVYFYNDYVKAYSDGSANSLKDYAKSYQRIKMSVTDDSMPLYQTFHYLYPKSSQKLASKNLKQYQKNAIEGLALDSIGYELHSYNQNSAEQNRENTKNTYADILKSFESFKMALYRPNDYLWKYTDAYYHMPMYSNQYSFYTDTVPFLSIVLKDSMEIYAKYINFFSNMNEQLLRMIDFNLMPSFIFTEELTRQLKYTNSNHMFTTQFEHWEDTVNEINLRFKDFYEKTLGQELISRNILEMGIVENVYKNQLKVIINYLNEPYVYQGKTIEASDFIIMEGN